MSSNKTFLNHEEFVTSITGSRPRMYYECAICSETVHSSVMSRHLMKYHDLTPQSYYDLVVPGSGKCSECGGKTNFEYLSHGYLYYCSNRCQMISRNRDPHFVELNRSIMINNHSKPGFKEALSESLSSWMGSDDHKRSCAKMIASRMEIQIKSSTINFYIAKSPNYPGLKFGICEDISRIKRFNGELIKQWLVPKEIGIELEVVLKGRLNQYGESFPEDSLPEVLRIIEELVNV